MDLAAPPAGSRPASPPGPIAETSPASPRIAGGVAALIADRLEVDALWIRIGFVLLALAGGIGILVYAGLWLVLVAGRWEAGTVPRVLGAVVLLAIVPLALDAGSFELLTGPAAVVLLLVGLTLALWQPRSGPAPAEPTPPARPPLGAPPVPGERIAGPWRVTERRPLPPRSALGRATLGAAIVVAAVGALIDQANGGRLHPEQWLGAAAAVCGLGLLVGALWGRGRWLVVPALVFAAAGFVAAPMARLGIGTEDLTGDRWVWLGPGAPGGSFTEHLVFGTVNIDATGEPGSVAIIDARVAIGEIRVTATDAVTVEIRSRVDDGTVRVDGRAGADEVVRIGPEGEPDVIVDAQVGRGDVVVQQHVAVEPEFLPAPPIVLDGPLVDAGPLRAVAEGVAVTSDGWIVLADGAAVIDGADQVIVGEAIDDGAGVAFISTPFGEFQLLPRSLLITPLGEVLDLAAIRAEVAPTTTSTTTPPSTPGG